MSLDWSVVDIKNYDVLTTFVNPSLPEGCQRLWHPVTESLVWATMAIGMNEITEKNWKEFYNRINLWEKTVGCYLAATKQPAYYNRFITPLEVHMHIGLYTNASSFSKTEFLKKIWEKNNEIAEKGFVKAEQDYVGFALDEMTEETFQLIQRQKDAYDTDQKLNAYRANRAEAVAE